MNDVQEQAFLEQLNQVNKMVKIRWFGRDGKAENWTLCGGGGSRLMNNTTISQLNCHRIAPDPPTTHMLVCVFKT